VVYWLYLVKLFPQAGLCLSFAFLGLAFLFLLAFVVLAFAVFLARLVWYWLCTCCIMVVTADCFDVSCNATVIQFISAPGDGTMLARTCFLPFSFPWHFSSCKSLTPTCPGGGNMPDLVGRYNFLFWLEKSIHAEPTSEHTMGYIPPPGFRNLLL
jgi:hypothetical protein